MRTHSQNHAHASFNIDLKLHFYCINQTQNQKNTRETLK